MVRTYRPRRITFRRKALNYATRAVGFGLREGLKPRFPGYSTAVVAYAAKKKAGQMYRKNRAGRKTGVKARSDKLIKVTGHGTQSKVTFTYGGKPMRIPPAQRIGLNKVILTDRWVNENDAGQIGQLTLTNNTANGFAPMHVYDLTAINNLNLNAPNYYQWKTDGTFSEVGSRQVDYTDNTTDLSNNVGSSLHTSSTLRLQLFQLPKRSTRYKLMLVKVKDSSIDPARLFLGTLGDLDVGSDARNLSKNTWGALVFPYMTNSIITRHEYRRFSDKIDILFSREIVFDEGSGDFESLTRKDVTLHVQHNKLLKYNENGTGVSDMDAPTIDPVTDNVDDGEDLAPVYTGGVTTTNVGRFTDPRHKLFAVIVAQEPMTVTEIGGGGYTNPSYNVWNQHRHFQPTR